MTQATTFSVPTVGPASPLLMASRIDDNLKAALSNHSGASRPSYAVAGTIWISTATVGKIKRFLFDGTNDWLLDTIDTATGAITWADGHFRIANETDATKKLAFDTSSIATGTTRTLKVPNSDVTISSFAATLLDDADGAAMWATLGAAFVKATSSYIKFPDGTIIQYGFGTNPGNDHTVTMPVTFPNVFRAGFAIGIGGGGMSGGNTLAFSCDVASLSGLNIRPRFVNNGGGVGIATQNYYWFGIGY